MIFQLSHTHLGSFGGEMGKEAKGDGGLEENEKNNFERKHPRTFLIKKHQKTFLGLPAL